MSILSEERRPSDGFTPSRRNVQVSSFLVYWPSFAHLLLPIDWLYASVCICNIYCKSFRFCNASYFWYRRLVSASLPKLQNEDVTWYLKTITVVARDLSSLALKVLGASDLSSFSKGFLSSKTYLFIKGWSTAKSGNAAPRRSSYCHRPGFQQYPTTCPNMCCRKVCSFLHCMVFLVRLFLLTEGLPRNIQKNEHLCRWSISSSGFVSEQEGQIFVSHWCGQLKIWKFSIVVQHHKLWLITISLENWRLWKEIMCWLNRNWAWHISAVPGNFHQTWSPFFVF
jgi:hypothetical protein